MQAVKDQIRHNNNWVKLHSVVRVTAARTTKRNGKTTTSTFVRYYICSLSKATAKQLNQAVRAHWGIENNLHWVIDMAFREDESRIRTGQAPANMAALRHIALNLIRQDIARKIGIKASRLRAGWNMDYMEQLLAGLAAA